MQVLRDVWTSLGQVGRIVLMVLVAALVWYVIDNGWGWELLRLVGML
jgi:hypothetical protein